MIRRLDYLTWFGIDAIWPDAVSKRRCSRRIWGKISTFMGRTNSVVDRPALRATRESFIELG